MQLFKRKKTKLSLIDDYIKIMLIYNFCNNSFDNCLFPESEQFEKLKKQNYKLKQIYEILFEKLNLNDLSLLILKKDIKNNNSLYLKAKTDNFRNLSHTINTLCKLLNLINLNLSEKIKILKPKKLLFTLNDLRIN